MFKASANESSVVLTDGKKTENVRKRMTDERRETVLWVHFHGYVLIL